MKILFIEDDRELVKSLLFYFSEQGFNCEKARSIEEGEAKIFNYDYDCVILDIGLPDDTGNEAYLQALSKGVKTALDASQADLAIYLAGADPFHGDRFGRLALTKEGLEERDRIVYQFCRQRHIPVATVMAGGYAKNVQDIVDIHLQTVRLASQLCL